MPPLENIFVLRHGESEEDVGPDIKTRVKDPEIGLTQNGIGQAKEAAENIRTDLVGFEHIDLFVSPYKRTQQTAEIIMDALKDDRIKMTTEPSLRGLDWGSVTLKNLKEIEHERYKVGVLHYNFPDGDKSSEYVRNIYDFVYKIIKQKHIKNDKKECAIIIAHGFSLRIVVKAFTEMTDEDFKWIKNPPHTFIARIYFDPQNNNFYMSEPLPTQKPIS
jgi:broad specificity phosphatase PhoE